MWDSYSKYTSYSNFSTNLGMRCLTFLSGSSNSPSSFPFLGGVGCDGGGYPFGHLYAYDCDGVVGLANLGHHLVPPHYNRQPPQFYNLSTSHGCRPLTSSGDDMRSFPDLPQASTLLRSHAM